MTELRLDHCPFLTDEAIEVVLENCQGTIHLLRHHFIDTPGPAHLSPNAIYLITKNFCLKHAKF